MAFRLKPHEAADEGIRRILRCEIEHALYTLLDAHADKQHIVHAVRTHCKKARATLRLAREAIGDVIYHRENRCFRDAARPLTALRDASVRIRTLKALSGKEFPAIHRLLVEEYHAACDIFLGRKNAFGKAVRTLEDAQFRIEDYAISKRRKKFRHGLRKTYKKGHQAAKIALRKPTTPHLHEWRKQTKYLRYQLELLRPPLLKTLRRQCKKLAQRLGDDHDLAMLSQWIAGTHIISRKDSRRLLPRIRRRRREIQKDALRLGKAAYDKKPSKLFIDWP